MIVEWWLCDRLALVRRMFLAGTGQSQLRNVKSRRGDLMQSQPARAK